MADILSIIAPVFVCAGLGWAWARSGRPFDRDFITSLIADVGAPCLVFSRLTALEVEPTAMAEIAAAALLAMATFAALSYVILRLAGLPRHTFIGPLVFGNAGNMGLPLCFFAFGEQGLALGVCYFATASVLHFTVGIWIWSGKASPGELLRTPLTYAVALAIATISLDIPVPVWLGNTTELLGGFAIPLMLLTLGVSLADMRIDHMGRALALSALRVGMGFAVGVALAAIFELQGAARGVLIIECSMPAAVINYLFAQRYDRSPEEVASVVVISTLIAFVGLPFLLRFVL